MDNHTPVKSGFSREKLAQITPALQKTVDAGDLSGFVTLIWQNGETVRLNTVGKRNIGANLSMTGDTLFRIASMTKPITSVAALMLMEEGRFKLSDPITTWAPEFADMRVLRRANGVLHDTVPAARAITFEDLFTHRAGLSYAFSAVGPIADAYQRTLGDVLTIDTPPDAWMKALSTLPLLYPPGERFHYSHATDVLGFLVGRIAGKPFRDVLMERIFTPLGMHDTDFYVPPEKRHRAAVVYRLDTATDTLKPVAFPTYDTPPKFCGGGGGLISTADDYLQFARLMLNKGELNGTRFLKPETIALMTQNHLTADQRAIPFLGSIPLWEPMGFGLGVSVITDPDKLGPMGKGAPGSFGWPGAFGTWWQADPQNNLIVIYLIQNSMPLEPGAITQLATGQRMGARVALPIFQNLVYGALEQPALK